MNLRRFLLYAAVGASGTAVQYIVLLGLVRSETAGPVSASSIGAIAGAIVNYALNYRFTFNSRESHARVAPKFFLVALLGFAVNGLAMTAMVHGVGLNYMVAQVIASAAVLLMSYTANAVWSFSGKTKKI